MIIDPTAPMMANINGKNVDVSYGIVDKHNQPYKKGNGLQNTKSRIETENRAKKDSIISEWISGVMNKLYPSESSKVDTQTKAEKLMKKHKIAVIQSLGTKADSVCIVQSRFFKQPVLISQKMWQWK